MKKRFVTTLFAFIACIACLLGFVACGDTDPVSVAGKTFVFEKLEVTEGLKGEEKSATEAQLLKMYKDDYIVFGEDDQFTMLCLNGNQWTYAQDGSKLTLTIDNETLEGKVSGNTITIVIKGTLGDGVSVSMTYKLSANKS